MAYSREMQAAMISVADELASAAGVAGGKVDGRPGAVVHGYGWRWNRAHRF